MNDSSFINDDYLAETIDFDHTDFVTCSTCGGSGFLELDDDAPLADIICDTCSGNGVVPSEQGSMS